METIVANRIFRVPHFWLVLPEVGIFLTIKKLLI